jgi:hypothetical protein
MAGAAGFLAIVYVLIIIGISIFVISLFNRFVKSVEKIADIYERKNNL